jgi:glycosyltransferase involved in cell wall biosynthesis
MTKRSTAARMFGYPLDGIAYNECLYRELAGLGIEAQRGEWSVRWLHRHLRRGDMLHLHWPSFYYYDPRSLYRTLKGITRFCAVLLLAWLKGVRIFWTAHNLYPHDGGRSLLVHRLARRLVIAVSERIFVHGPSAAATLEHEFPGSRRKHVLIEHGHWIDYYPPHQGRAQARASLGLRPETFVYGFVGSCKPYKGLEELISAFARLSGDFTLLIAGHFQSETYASEIRQRVATLPANRVVLVPRFLADDEIQRHVVAIDALILPFREVLTSGSLILGLSFGIPVVAPRIGAVVDVMNPHTGVLYDPQQPQALVRAMQQVRTTRFDAAQIIDHARTLTWNSAANALLEAASDEHFANMMPPDPVEHPGQP